MKKLNSQLREFGDLDMGICDIVKRKYGEELTITMYGKFNSYIMPVLHFVFMQRIKLKEKQNER